MYTRTLYNIYKKALMTLCFVVAVSCTDELGTDQTGTENPQNQDKGIGELVLFSTGNVGNTTTRAEVCPYMEQDGRFVCKMYYHAKATDTDASPFDTISTPITSWLRVNDNVGNSVYWNKNFTDVNNDGKVNEYDLTEADRGNANYKDYGFDPNAQFFYWRNRLDHIFLAYTDYNKLKTNTYGTTQGKLFMYPERDGDKRTKVGEDVLWPTVNYRMLSFGTVQKPNPAYSQIDKDARDAAIAAWETAKAAWEADPEHEGTPYTDPKPEPYDVPATIDGLGLKGINTSSSYPYYDGYFPLSTPSSSYSYITQGQINAAQTKLAQLVDEADFLSSEEKTALKADLDRSKESDDENTVEGVFHNDRWIVLFDPEATDAFVDGALNFGAEKVTVYCRRAKKEIEDIIADAPANTFNLQRTTSMAKMTDQPDPLIALTKMKPMGATQEANRVRLHFKHQFSQIQVNLVNAENTAEITAENIVSVELLGVTKKGYVFTNINPDGTQIPPSYDPVIISQYSEEQLKENPYGTSFNMFTMADTEKPATSLKSFNAIAFGQLQAIRITWQEEATGESYTTETAAEENNKHLVNDASGKKPGEDGYITTYKAGYTPVNSGDVVPPVKHIATYKITVDDRNNSLVNLRSGYRYMYDFELRRGTIAFIRATIDGWLLDDELNYGTSGTINE